MRFEFIVSQPLAAVVGTPARSDRRVPLDVAPSLETPSLVTNHAPDRDAVDRTDPIQPLAVDAGGANLDDELALASTEGCRTRSDEGGTR